MAKKDRKILQQVQIVARLGRTALATRLLEKKLYAGQDQLMLALALQDGQTPGQLSAELGVRPPTITKTISRLTAQGFLDKRGSDSDARQAHIFLTDSGREAIMMIEKSVKKTEKKALDGLDKKDRKTLYKLLKKIEGNLSLEDKDDGDEADAEDGDDEGAASIAEEKSAA
jgi:DNA-binding MarR family transcriptional regulator